MVKLKHIDDIGTARFITFSCKKRYRLFTGKYMYALFELHLENFRNRFEIHILGYVIMPNHVHLVLYPENEIELGRAIGNLKSRFSFEILQIWKKKNRQILKRLEATSNDKKRYAFWQKRCYDHNCRTPETVREKINYCHKNPVRAGLVENIDEWRWSSYRWYMGDRTGRVQITELES